MKILKKSLSFFLFFFFISFYVHAMPIDINSKYAVLYNLDEGTTLYEKNADDVISIASLTKIMTAIVAIENIRDLDESVTLIGEDFAGLIEANASVANFRISEVVTYRDLLYGLLFPSGADAAQALTRLLGGKEHFINLMNQKAEELGLTNTHFVNETGLDAEGHYSTVKEVAVFFLYALENTLFREIIESDSYTTSNKRLNFKSTLSNYLTKYSIQMDYILGGKTGMTDNAGLCLASFARSNDTNYLLVTAGAKIEGPTHVKDAKAIYDYFIENYQNQIILEKGSKILELPLLFNMNKLISFHSEKNIVKYLPKDYKESDITYIYSGKDYVLPWDKLGFKIGTIKIMYQNEFVASLSISLEENNVLLLPYLIIFFLIIIFIIKRKLKKSKNKRKKWYNT